ncbi:MAG: protein-L-isoaspartate(D-aspartate) O-methyltransferase [Polyangiaceae bacterium]|nr:protein-L-isoaspartate(D-aspartate) O-methyltransferase [Polyangiaceae bacterium]
MSIRGALGFEVNSEADPPEARRLRWELVRRIAAVTPWPEGEVWDERVLAVMAAVPRHLFVPEMGLYDAYRDEPLPIGNGQTISQPTMVALMTQALHLTGRERVLEVGTGSGYQAAILSPLAREVWSVERIEALGNAAMARFAALGIQNVHVRIGDGYQGLLSAAPFHRIVLTAAPAVLPHELTLQLADGGICVAPVGDAFLQTLMRWTKKDGKLSRESLGAVRFVPMLEGVE